MIGRLRKQVKKTSALQVDVCSNTITYVHCIKEKMNHPCRGGEKHGNFFLAIILIELSIVNDFNRR